jgi:MoaA/NifB/PqqE/SkfB family radical SAM enzyme
MNLLKILSIRQNHRKNSRLALTAIPGFNCNMKCMMCRNWTVKRPAETLDWKRFISGTKDYAKGFEGVDVNIGGGEPYLNPEIYGIMSASKDSGYSCGISTNGYLADKRTVQKSREHGLTGISLSLDSMDETMHDSMRGCKDAYARVMRAADEAKEAGLHVSVTAVIMKNNISHIGDVARWAIGRNITINIQSVVAPFQTAVEPGWQLRYPEIWPDDLEEVDHAIEDLLSVRKSNPLLFHNTEKQLLLFRKYFHDPMRFLEHKSCPLTSLDTFTIDPDGSIRLCPLMGPIGNITKDRLSSAAMSKEAKKAVEAMSRCRLSCHYLMNCYYREER